MSTADPVAPTQAGGGGEVMKSISVGNIAAEVIEEGEEDEEEEEQAPAPAPAPAAVAAETAKKESAEDKKKEKKKKKKSKGAKGYLKSGMKTVASPGIFIAKTAQKGVETVIINPTMAAGKAVGNTTVGKAVGKGVETVVVNPTMAVGKAVGKGVETVVVNPTMAAGKAVGDTAKKVTGTKTSDKKKKSGTSTKKRSSTADEKGDKKDKSKSSSSSVSSKRSSKHKSSGLTKLSKGLGLDTVQRSDYDSLKKKYAALEDEMREKLEEKDQEIEALRAQLRKIADEHQEITIEEVFSKTPTLAEKRAQKRLMEEKANILMTEGHNSGKLKELDDSSHSTSSAKSRPSTLKIVSKAKDTEMQRLKRKEESKMVHKMRNMSTRGHIFTPHKTENVTANFVGGGDDYKPPTYPKSPESVTLINNALKKNVFFDKFDQDDFDRMIPSFEKVLVKNGEHIITQGDKADFFYIVAKGKVIYKVDGKLVGEASKEQSFGELSLLYTSPRAASVIALTNPTELFRIDQRAFRSILQNKAKEFEKQKLELLKSVQAFQGVTDSDLYRLADCMIMRQFKADQVVVRKGEVGNCFYIIHSGSMRVTDIGDGTSASEGIELSKGEYFGERALINDEKRSANVVGNEAGACFAIDRVTFEKVLGQFSTVIMRSHDKDVLANIKNIKDSNFTDAMIETLSSAIIDITFKAGDEIVEKGVKQQGALFLIREGRVKIEKGGETKILYKDEYFGDEQISKFTPNEITPDYGAVAETDLVCGFLGLKQFPKLSLDGTEPAEDDVANTRIMRRRSTIRESFRFRKVELDKMDKLQLLGEGQFGAVHLVKASNVAGERRASLNTSDKMVTDSYALKYQDLAEFGGIAYKGVIEREQKVLESMRHPFVVDLIHTQIIGTDAYMLMNCITCGELWAVVHSQSEDGDWASGVPEDHARFYAIVVADAIAFMHNAKVVYRDLKPENVMIDKEGYPNIIDFGFAKEIEGKTYTFCGTPNYIAPEIVTQMGHSFGVDHWAFGILIYEMISGENPFYYEGMEHAALLETITNTEPYPISKECSDEAKQLIEALLQKDPTARIGMLAGKENDILEHAWFKDIDLKKLREKEVPAPIIPPSMIDDEHKEEM